MVRNSRELNGDLVSDVNLRQRRQSSQPKMSTEIRLVGDHIGAARRLLRLSQADLAAIAGVSEATIQKFEAGLHSPRPSTRKVLRDALEQRGIEFTNGDSPGARFNPAKAIIPRGT